MEYSLWSLWLDAREFDDLGPLLCFLGDELSEVGRRAGKHRGAQFGKARLHSWFCENGIYLPVEFVDDIGGRVPGRADAMKSACLVARHDIGHGRNVRQRLCALRCRHRQRAQLSGLDVLDRPGDRIEHDLDLDRKSTRLNSSHLGISYAVFCLK